VPHQYLAAQLAEALQVDEMAATKSLRVFFMVSPDCVKAVLARRERPTHSESFDLMPFTY
jgi:hypothetical protein